MATDQAGPAVRPPIVAQNPAGPVALSPVAGVPNRRRADRRTGFRLGAFSRISARATNGPPTRGLPTREINERRASRFNNVLTDRAGTDSVTSSGHVRRKAHAWGLTHRKAPSGFTVITRSPPLWRTRNDVCAA